MDKYWLDSIDRPKASDKHISRELFTRLDKNENLDNEYLDRLVELIGDGGRIKMSMYPESIIDRLYRSIARWNNTSIDSIFVSNGSDGIIKAVFETFAGPSDFISFPNPTFAMYEIYARIYHLPYTKLNYDKNFTFEVPIEMLETRGCALLCIPNPNSPTGSIHWQDELEYIIKICKEHNTIVLIDEAYYPYYSDSMAKFIKDWDNLIIARSFSKAFGLAGYRVGYAIANPKLIKRMNAQKPMYEIGTVSAIAANIALCDTNLDNMFASVYKTMKLKKDVCDTLESMGFEIYRGFANFFHICFSKNEMEKQMYIDAIKEEKFLFKEKFDHPCLEGYCRFTVGNKYQMSKLLNTIKWVKESL